MKFTMQQEPLIQRALINNSAIAHNNVECSVKTSTGSKNTQLIMYLN
jgi:hypothetical protein